MDESSDPPREQIRDTYYRMTRTGINALTFGAGGEIFDMVVGPPIEKRRDEWRERIGQRLQDLEKAGFVTLKDLEDNAEFVTTVMHASQVAVRNHQEEKLGALQNGVTNVAIDPTHDDAERQMFIQFIDDLTVWHLRLLRFLNDPKQWYAESEKQPPDYAFAGSLIRVIHDAFQELAGRDDFTKQVYSDLESRGLVARTDISTSKGGVGLLQSQTVDFGKRFLAFITDHTAAPDG